MHRTPTCPMNSSTWSPLSGHYMYHIVCDPPTQGPFLGGGGGGLGSKYAWMCVSKSEGHGSFFSFREVK